MERYLMNHLGSTMLVYGTQGIASTDAADLGGAKAAYDYRAFGEQVSMMEPAEKVTENFTGKELDDEIELNYFGARYLDPMLGLWISVDPARQFSSPYLYAGNGYNPISFIDGNGGYLIRQRAGKYEIRPFSSADFYTGVLVRDLPGVVFSLIPNPVGYIYGLIKGYVQGEFDISAITSSGTLAASHATEAVIVGKYTAGSLVGSAFSGIDFVRGVKELNDYVDSQEYISALKNSFNRPGVYNSFDSYDAAKQYAENIKSFVEEAPASYEPNGDCTPEFGEMVIDKDEL